MSITNWKPPPVPEGAHGSWCQGGEPGRSACQACTVAQVKLCVAFWETMGGVPEMVRVHIEERLTASAKRVRAGENAKKFILT